MEFIQREIVRWIASRPELCAEFPRDILHLWQRTPDRHLSAIQNMGLVIWIRNRVRSHNLIDFVVDAAEQMINSFNEFHVMADKQRGGFLKEILLEPHDWNRRLIYSDWLEERGLTKEATAQRWMCKHAVYPTIVETGWGHDWIAEDSFPLMPHWHIRHKIAKKCSGFHASGHAESFIAHGWGHWEYGK